MSMSDQFIDDVAAYACDHAAPHLAQLAEMQRAGTISAGVIFPTSQGIVLPPNIGAVITLYDRRSDGVGPSGFVQPLLEQLMAACAGFIVIARGPHNVKPYALACHTAAETRRPALIIETWPAHEQAWVDLVPLCRGPMQWMVWAPGVDLMSAVMAGSA